MEFSKRSPRLLPTAPNQVNKITRTPSQLFNQILQRIEQESWDQALQSFRLFSLVDRTKKLLGSVGFEYALNECYGEPARDPIQRRAKNIFRHLPIEADARGKSWAIISIAGLPLLFGKFGILMIPMMVSSSTPVITNPTLSGIPLEVGKICEQQRLSLNKCQQQMMLDSLRNIPVRPEQMQAAREIVREIYQSEIDKLELQLQANPENAEFLKQKLTRLRELLNEASKK